MATRNPLNQRYQGDGPGGQSRKSASSAKPVSKAAASVHVKKKPTTASEKRAAAKARQKEADLKAKQKAAKQAEKAKAEAALKAGSQETPAPEKTRGLFSSLKNPATDGIIKTEEYRKWKKIYWILLGVGIVAVIGSFMATNLVAGGLTAFYVFLVIAYAAIIGSFIIDIRKIKPLQKKHNVGVGASAKKSPKELKHEQEAREEAAMLEAARKAAREKKKDKLQRDRVLAPGEDEALDTPGEKNNTKEARITEGTQ